MLIYVTIKKNKNFFLTLVNFMIIYAKKSFLRTDNPKL